MNLAALFQQPRGNGAANRVLRGFWRIAVACSALILIAGISITAIEGINDANSYRSKHQAIVCLRKLPPENLRAEISIANWVDVKASGCAKESYVILTFDDLRAYNIESARSWYEKFLDSWRFGLPIALFAAALSFGVIYGVGWVVAGFFKDEK